MAIRTIIPFGPQHPVLPEPVHLKISVDDEVITGKDQEDCLSLREAEGHFFTAQVLATLSLTGL